MITHFQACRNSSSFVKAHTPIQMKQQGKSTHVECGLRGCEFQARLAAVLIDLCPKCSIREVLRTAPVLFVHSAVQVYIKSNHMCACMYVCMYIHIYIHTHMYTNTHAYLYHVCIHCSLMRAYVDEMGMCEVHASALDSLAVFIPLLMYVEGRGIQNIEAYTQEHTCTHVETKRTCAYSKA
jgi:hypothetical protein